LKEVNLVIKEGNDPACTHYELIEGMVGTCKWCGRVKDYNKVVSLKMAPQTLDRERYDE
jgi:hypothetical protein